MTAIVVSGVTADELLTRVKSRAQVPDADGRLGSTSAAVDASIFTIIDDLMQTAAFRSIYDADDGRRVATAANVSITKSQPNYRIPSRAWGGDVDSVHLITSTGEEVPLHYVDRSEIYMWDQAGLWADPRYTILGNTIRLLPSPADSNYSLRVRYLRRPNKLVKVATCTLLTASAASTLTGTIGSGWSSPTTIDVIKGTHGGYALEDDIPVTYTGTTITRTTGSNATTGASIPEAGDYACLAGETCVVQCPDVAISFLVARASAEVCDAIGDEAGMRRHMAFAERKQSDLEQAISKRTKENPRVISRYSPLRAAGMYRRRGWRWGN